MKRIVTLAAGSLLFATAASAQDCTPTTGFGAYVCGQINSGSAIGGYYRRQMENNTNFGGFLSRSTGYGSSRSPVDVEPYPHVTPEGPSIHFNSGRDDYNRFMDGLGRYGQ